MRPDWLDFERRHVWHPYARLLAPGDVYPVREAQGVEIVLEDGTRLVDGMASWWCAIHGYRVPELDAAIRAQLEKMAHVMFGGLTHEPAARLAERLLALAPGSFEAVFFADSGSVAVEVAMKMALQYWAALGKPRKKRFLTIRGGYHGDTWHAMSVCDPVQGMHRLFVGALPEQLFAPRPRARFGSPDAGEDLRAFRRLAEAHADEIAAVILEPIVQGAGGMWFYSAAFLAGVRAICDELGLLLILDEIATGFGRTGRMFACEHAGISGDIMCVGKALTGGYLTMGAVLATRQVVEGVEAQGWPLMHGPTFMANPLAAAVSSASLDLLTRSPWQARVRKLETRLREGLAPLRGTPGVKDVRVLGAIGVVEMERPVPVEKAQRAAIAEGVWLRPFARLIYAMPPYVLADDDAKLERLIRGIRAAVRAAAT
ncbi:MAG: adenosylmethionine--8-amino-7-oxononanoate transaminase [Zetaproteobacteria bacterium]|nr:MAG: adenosylmethionine--8-amino-7-oxononanoate transaminase [Zetaproteobacteria bacterium]